MGSVAPVAPRQNVRRILFASLVGTTIEFYDFYIYATAASLIFGPLFFPASVPSMELIGAYASFGLAFMARPLGGAVFGHFGDRIGRKTTLVASLLLMGGSTAAIGFLPTYALAGWLAPLLLCLLRLGQGLALGGEWTGATLLALENAPSGWRARYAMFAPLGAPLGFIIANGLFLLLTLVLDPGQFRDWGWRVPFLASLPLVWIGLWVRINLVETREFAEALAQAPPPRVPLLELLGGYPFQVIIGTFGVVACFSLYYTATAFALGYGTTTLGYTRSTFLLAELGAILFMAGSIIVASWLADRFNPESILSVGCVGTVLAGIVLSPMLGSGSLAMVFGFLAFALFVMGFVNGPLAAWLPELFPPRVRYSGTSVAFNFGGILGGAFSPMIAQALAQNSGLAAVGFYLAVTGGVSLSAFGFSARRRTQEALAQSEKRYRSLFEQAHISLYEMDLAGWKEALEERVGPGSAGRRHALHRRATLDHPPESIRVVNGNEAMVRLLSAESKADVLGPINRFLVDSAPLTTALETAIRGRSAHIETQLRLRTCQGHELTALLLMTLPDDEASFSRVSGAMLDITEREAARETLMAAQQELARVGRISTVGAISASIAHEVAQPIGAVIMSVQACMRWLQREVPDIEAATRAAERAVKDGIRASEIVQRTREQLRQVRRQPQSVDLRQVIEEAVRLLDREVLATGTRVQMDLGRTGAHVIADRVELQQVIINLMTNGMHAMSATPEEHRLLDITLRREGEDLVALSVRDHGSGISQDNLAKLFNPFFTTRHEGIGIGLAICRTIVESAGGSLQGRNSEGRGAVFEVRLPLAVATHDEALAVGASATSK